MKLLSLLFLPTLVHAATINCESWNYKPAICDTKIKGAVVTLGTPESGSEKLCPPTNWSTSVGPLGTTQINVINGCRASFNVSLPPSPSPSPSPSAVVFIQTDGGNQQAPQAFWVSALPPVPHNCFTDGVNYVGLSKPGTIDTESGLLPIIHSPPQAGDASWSASLIAAVQSCIRQRDLRYNSDASKSNLLGGSILGSSYQWDFGDPGSKFNLVGGFSAAHVYSRAGTYTIKLTITTDNGKTLQGMRSVSVPPSTRKVFNISSQLDFDALVKASGGNRQINLARGAQFTMTQGLTLGSNDWITSPGTGPLPILWTNFKVGAKIFYLGINNLAHIQVDSLDIRVKNGSVRPLVSEPSDTNVVFKDIVLSRGPTWVGPSRAFTLQGDLQMLQNVGAPLDAQGHPQSDGITQNFVFITGSHIALYGNRGYVSAIDGNQEPGWRACGTIENVSVVNNVIGGFFGKSSVISMRGGHNTYFGDNTILGGVFNFQGGCSPALTPSTTNTNILVENNIQEDNAFQINPAVYNVMYRGNKTHMSLVPPPWVGNQEAVALSSYNSKTPAISPNPITYLNNQILFDQTFGKVFQIGDTPPGQITVVGNQVTESLNQGRPIYQTFNAANIASFNKIQGNHYKVPKISDINTTPMAPGVPFSKWNGSSPGISGETIESQ